MVSLNQCLISSTGSWARNDHIGVYENYHLTFAQ